MACAIEDAGFEIRDMISWNYGSGFPKSLNIHKKDNRCPEGWGTALKPAHEPIVVARKPLSEKTVAQNVLKWGTGGINIDGCRVETDDKLGGGGLTGSVSGSDGWDRPWRHNKEAIDKKTERTKEAVAKGENLGRFPANFIHDGIDEVWSRFFYCAKASKSERNKGLEGLETTEKFTAGNYSQSPTCKTCDKTLNGTNDHSKCSGEVYYKEMDSKTTKNNHPTVKPVSLMRYLCKLITPVGGTVLDPFTGSGTTGIGAKLEGFKFIGIEREEDYCRIAEARIKAWQPEIRLL